MIEPVPKPPPPNGKATNGARHVATLGRVPPNDLDAERSLLGGIILHNSTPNHPLRQVSEYLQPQDFYRTAHRKIYEAMLSLDEDRVIIDRVSLCDRLRELGALEAVGGEDFIDLLDTVVPSASNLGYYGTKIHERALARRLIEAAHAIASQGYEGQGPIGELLEEAERRIRAVTTQEDRKSLLRHALVLSPASIRADLTPREYLLRRATDGVGVLAMGKVGMLAASGGSGKSYALVQLGIAVATGTTWLGSGLGWSARKGRALLVLAEEDATELSRRIHHACRAAGLVGDEILAELAQNLLVLPLCGRGVSLTAGENLTGALPKSRFAGDLTELLVDACSSKRPFVFVGLDPLSRFAGPDVETDNAAATKFVEVVETLASPECGAPAVMLVHHVRKKTQLESSDPGASPIRGSSALVDGVRWAAILEKVKTRDSAEQLMRLSVVKSNYAPAPPPLILSRVEDCGGAMQIAKTFVDHDESLPVVESISQAIIDKVFAKLPAEGDGVSKSFLVNVAKVQKQAGMQAVDILVDAGKAIRTPRGKYLSAPVPGGSEPSSENPGTSGSGAPLLLFEKGATGTEFQSPGTVEREEPEPEPKAGKPKRPATPSTHSPSAGPRSAQTTPGDRDPSDGR